jgi:hypothetical protein
MLKRIALACGLLAALFVAVPMAHATCPATVAGTIQGSNAIALQATQEAACADLDALAGNTGASAITGMYSANISNTATAANASATTLYSINAGNTNSTGCYLQMWNLAAGSVTVGTTAPYSSFLIPANGAGMPVNLPRPIRFGTALTVAATTTRAGSTACTFGLDVNLPNQ